jgi:hypothetical protein
VRLGFIHDARGAVTDDHTHVLNRMADAGALLHLNDTLSLLLWLTQQRSGSLIAARQIGEWELVGAAA